MVRDSSTTVVSLLLLSEKGTLFQCVFEKIMGSHPGLCRSFTSVFFSINPAEASSSGVVFFLTSREVPFPFSRLQTSRFLVPCTSFTGLADTLTLDSIEVSHYPSFPTYYTLFTVR